MSFIIGIIVIALAIYLPSRQNKPLISKDDFNNYSNKKNYDLGGSASYTYLDKHGTNRSIINNSRVYTYITDYKTGDVVTMDEKGIIYKNFSQEQRDILITRMIQHLRNMQKIENEYKSQALRYGDKEYRGYDWANPVRVTESSCMQTFPEVWKSIEDDHIIEEKGREKIGLSRPMETWIDTRNKKKFVGIREMWNETLKKEGLM